MTYSRETHSALLDPSHYGWPPVTSTLQSLLRPDNIWSLSVRPIPGPSHQLSEAVVSTSSTTGVWWSVTVNSDWVTGPCLHRAVSPCLRVSPPCCRAAVLRPGRPVTAPGSHRSPRATTVLGCTRHRAQMHGVTATLIPGTGAADRGVIHGNGSKGRSWLRLFRKMLIQALQDVLVLRGCFAFSYKSQLTVLL